MALCLCKRLLATGLSGPATTHSLQGPQNRKDAGLPDQQLRLAGVHDYRALPLPLAGRTLLQVDQAAFADQGVLRHIGERSQIADLDRRIRLRPCRDRQKAAQAPRQPLSNPTDPELDPFRENPDGSATFPRRGRSD